MHSDKHLSFKYKIPNTDKCTFCEKEQEILLHLFIKCPTTKNSGRTLSSGYKNTKPMKTSVCAVRHA